jgi:hypothetical protein
MVCRVLSKQTVITPGKSRATISVNLENGEHVANLGLVDHATKLKNQGIIMTRGVLEPHKPDIRVQMTNFMDERVTIHTNEQIGICESYNEQEAPHCGTCQHIHLGKFCLVTCNIYLRGAFFTYHQMITTNLQQLLTKYQDIFARPNDDLGQTLVQHRINTGTAKLIQKAPMRLPLGKREMEKEKIDKMLDRRVI